MKARFDGSHYVLQQLGARERLAITPREAHELFLTLGLEISRQNELGIALPGPHPFSQDSNAVTVEEALYAAKQRLDP